MPPEVGNRNERILIWHDWDGQAAAFLDTLIVEYTELNPGVDIILSQVPPDQMLDQYVDRAKGGLGPDIVLANSALVLPLVERGLIKDIASDGVDAAIFFEGPRSAVEMDGALYGVPFAMSTQVLFYDKSVLDRPPTTTDDLLDLGAQGYRVALRTDFPASFWLLGTHYGRMLSADNKVTFDQGGGINWIEDIKTLRSQPGIVFESDRKTLSQLFIDQEVAVYVGDSRELPVLRQAISADRLGVSVLPSGLYGGPASPVIDTKALMISEVASPSETQLALELVQFLTNPQQQLSLAVANIGYIPASNQTLITSSLPAESLAVARQIRTGRSIGLDTRPVWDGLNDPSGHFIEDYRAALSGEISSLEFVNRTVDQVVEEYGYERVVVNPADLCPDVVADITMWHSTNGADRAALLQLAQSFSDLCPGVSVALEYISGNYNQTVLDAGESGTLPEALYQTTFGMARLVDLGYLREVTDFVPVSYLQQFKPDAVNALRYLNKLYAVPNYLTIVSLFYNKTLVTEPPIDLDGLLAQAAEGNRVALPMTFYYGFWGIAAMGFFDFDYLTGRINEAEGLELWLDWLQEHQNNPGMFLTTDFAAAEEEFLSGRAAYFVSGQWSLPALLDTIGRQNLGVAQLPFGPNGSGAPYLQPGGVMVTSLADDDETRVAVAFAQYLNLTDSQELFLQSDTYVPANILFDLSDRPLIAGFQAQAGRGTSQIVYENVFNTELERLGNETFKAVLDDGVAPSQAVEELIEAVHAANGVVD